MALTPVPSINLEGLPREAISLIETLASRAQEADRLEQEPSSMSSKSKSSRSPFMLFPRANWEKPATTPSTSGRA